jgi:gliding motility-associated-like protein
MVYYNSGTYLFNYFDANGCASTDTLILTINHSTRSITNITICSAQLPYNWNGNTYLSTGNYLITLTNSYGCDSMAMLHLVINPSPEPPTVNTPVNYCQYDQTEELSASGLYNLIWYSSPTDNTGSSNQPIPNANIPGTYLYYVSQSNGTCVSPRSVITVHINPKPSIGNDKEYKICFGATINLQLLYLGNNINTTWTLNNIPVINTTNVSTAGNYQVIAENTYGCYDTANVRLIVQPKVIANAGNDENVMSNVPFQLHGSGGVQYLWTPSNYLNNPSIQNPIAIITNTMNFILTVKDDIGCTDSDTVKFRILDGPTFYVPNAFTPDGDGLNDIFRPVYVGIQKLNYFRVYDRYGLIVYETNIIGNGWNGFFRSKPQIMGNYVYVVSAVDKNNNTIVKKGNVVLIR